MNTKTLNTLVDRAVPNTHYLAKTITDKQNKYQELANEICAIWKQKAAQVIPIVIPDIIIRDTEKGTCMLIDVAISEDRNVIKKEAEKILKFSLNILQ